MTVEQTASLGIGLLSGLGSWALQATTGVPDVPSLAGFLIPVVSAMIGAAMGYGVLKSTVETMRSELTGVRDNLADVHRLLRDVSTRVARIEGRLDAES